METKNTSLPEVLRLIKEGETFETNLLDDSIRIKIVKYVPYVCTAIHNGSALREKLAGKINLKKRDRWRQEAPLTKELISSFPITIVANDSRFEYDLNEDLESAVDASVWAQKLSKKDIAESKKKHANYFKVIHALITKLNSMFDSSIVFDVNAYNYKHFENESPLFCVVRDIPSATKYNSAVNLWIENLQNVKIPEIINITETSKRYKTVGYHCKYICENFPNTLILPTYIKKIYCDELTGDTYPKMLRQLQQQLKTAIVNTTDVFISEHSSQSNIEKLLFKKGITPAMLKVDKALSASLKNFELLAAVNPTNTISEKKVFFKNNYSKLPNFKYKPIKINPYTLKQKILSLPVQDIQDVSMKSLYETVINSYLDRIDLISTINTNKFQYNSLRYFGRPSKKDISNAHYIMHLPDIQEELQTEEKINTHEAIIIFDEILKNYDIPIKIEINNKILAKVMVSGAKNRLYIQHGATFTIREIYALAEHEIGIHLVTTLNARTQKLKIFSLGFPLNTETQEGLAILAEYLSGNLTLDRLKKIALRVIIVDMMCSGANFIDCFSTLTTEYKVDRDDAFSIVTRIFRGGGFTKDYLYLSGFVKMYKLWLNDISLSPLLVGKVSNNNYDIIEEMIDREMIKAPIFITKSFKSPNIEQNSNIYPYILSGLR